MFHASEDVITDIQLLSQLTTVGFASGPLTEMLTFASSVFVCTELTATNLPSSWVFAPICRKCLIYQYNQLEAIKETKVDMQVFLGNYPAATDGGEAYARQRDIIKQAIQDYGTDHIAGVTVGNEFILKYVFSYRWC